MNTCVRWDLCNKDRTFVAERYESKSEMHRDANLQERLRVGINCQIRAALNSLQSFRENK